MFFWALIILFAILIPSLIGLVITIEENELEEKRKNRERNNIVAVAPWNHPRDNGTVSRYGRY